MLERHRRNILRFAILILLNICIIGLVLQAARLRERSALFSLFEPRALAA